MLYTTLPFHKQRNGKVCSSKLHCRIDFVPQNFAGRFSPVNVLYDNVLHDTAVSWKHAIRQRDGVLNAPYFALSFILFWRLLFYHVLQPFPPHARLSQVVVLTVNKKTKMNKNIKYSHACCSVPYRTYDG